MVAQQLADGGAIPPEPAIGYAVAYPITVLLTIVGVLAIFVGLMLNAMRAIMVEVRRSAKDA